MVSVAGVLCRLEYVLIARRVAGGDLGGLWEFPGGKVEEGEADEDALVREFHEELGVDVGVRELLAEGSFVHKGKDFTLRCYRVDSFVYDFTLLDHDMVQWVKAADLAAVEGMAPSDKNLIPEIVAALERGVDFS